MLDAKTKDSELVCLDGTGFGDAALRSHSLQICEISSFFFLDASCSDGGAIAEATAEALVDGAFAADEAFDRLDED